MDAWGHASLPNLKRSTGHRLGRESPRVSENQNLRDAVMRMGGGRFEGANPYAFMFSTESRSLNSPHGRLRIAVPTNSHSRFLGYTLAASLIAQPPSSLHEDFQEPNYGACSALTLKNILPPLTGTLAVLCWTLTPFTVLGVPTATSVTPLVPQPAAPVAKSALACAVTVNPAVPWRTL